MTFETSNKNVKNVDILKQDQRKMITPHLPAHVVVAQGASFSDQGLRNQGGWEGDFEILSIITHWESTLD